MRQRKKVFARSAGPTDNPPGGFVYVFQVSNLVRQLTVVVQLCDSSNQSEVAQVLETPSRVINNMNVNMEEEFLGMHSIPEPSLWIDRKLKEIYIDLKYSCLSPISDVNLGLNLQYQEVPVVQGVYLEYQDEY